MPENQSLSYTKQLDLIQNQISALAPQISDNDFRLNPIKKFRELNDCLKLKTIEIAALTKDHQELQENIENPVDSSEIPLIVQQSKEKFLLAKLSDLKVEMTELEKEKEDLDKDSNCRKYMLLFIQSERIKRSLANEPKKQTPTITPTKSTDPTLNLSQNLTQAFEKHPILLTRLNEAYKFEVVKSEDETKTKLFSKTHQHNLEVSNDRITSPDPITEEKQKDIVPAMMFIFVQSIAGKGLTEFTITAETPQLIAFMENTLALQLKTLPEKLVEGKINGIPITDILARSDPRSQKENIENTATPTTLRP